MATVWDKKGKAIQEFTKAFPLDQRTIDQICDEKELAKAVDIMRNGPILFGRFYDLSTHDFSTFNKGHSYEDVFNDLPIKRVNLPKYSSYGSSYSMLRIIYIHLKEAKKAGIVFRKHSPEDNWLVLPQQMADENIGFAANYVRNNELAARSRTSI